tara:strand:+ start:14095 stop:15000 length:906 start_codon:yes stop_codon:yes gene_type:complete
MNNALIIGYGSIGQLHFKILKKLKIFDKIYLFTSQKIKSKDKIHSLNRLNNLNIQYVVIASPTSMHKQHLLKINNQLKNKKILVEKPLFNSLMDKNLKLNNDIYVGYDLRYHPVISKLKNIVKNQKIWTANVFCGSYLPNWRAKRDYTKTSSAIKKLGGGVLNDLSHEFDYLNWIFGNIKVLYSFNKKISNLKINTDDIVISINKHKKGLISNVVLNYYTRPAQRKLIIDGEKISISADIIKNEINYFYNNKLHKSKFKNIKREFTHYLMHKDIIFSAKPICCNYIEAIEVQKILNKIKLK